MDANEIDELEKIFLDEEQPSTSSVKDSTSINKRLKLMKTALNTALSFP